MPLRSEFASGRSQTPFDSSSVAITSGSATTASYMLYLSLQGENQLGLNLPATPIGPFKVAPGQQLVITIPTTAFLAGESWQNFVLSASTSGDPMTFVQLAKLPGDRQLPSSITLNNDDAFALSRVVASPSALPTGPVNGQLRGVASLNYVYEYVGNSALAVDGTTVLAAPVGRWLRVGATFSTYVDDITAGGGCAQDIRDINESQVRVPGYACDRSLGTATRFWLHNDSGASVPSGKRVGLVVQFNGETKTQAFHGLLRLVFRGYANTATGELRSYRSDGSAMAGVDEEVRFQANKSNLILQDDLQPGEAYVLDVTPSFDVADLGGAIVNAAVIKVFPFLYTQAGSYSEAGAVVGDVIYAEGDRRLVVPDLGLTALALSGSGMVDSFSFIGVATTPVFGLAVDTANQAIAIDHDGDVAVRSLPLPTTEALRALVSTVNGVGNPCDWSSNAVVSAGSSLSITCNYPCDAFGIGTIRSDYPDAKMRSVSKGKFNPKSVVVYVKRLSDGEIRRFSGSTVIPGTSQIFTISSWGEGTVITAIPTNADSAFGLFAPTSCAIASASGSTDFVAGNYQAAFAFEYENAITSISHAEEEGCILTASAPLAEVFVHLDRTDNPHQVTAIQIGKNTAQWNADRLQGRAIADTTPVDEELLAWKQTPQQWTPVSALKALKLQLIDFPVETRSNEVAVFVLSSDPNIVKIRLPNNGEIQVLGSGSTPIESDTEIADWKLTSSDYQTQNNDKVLVFSNTTPSG